VFLRMHLQTHVYRAEDRIRAVKDTGLTNLPLAARKTSSFAIGAAYLSAGPPFLKVASKYQPLTPLLE
jgi:hypothetical protein